MKKNNETARAIYLTGSFFMFLCIHYLFSINSSAFSWGLYIFPITLFILGIMVNKKRDEKQ